MNRATRRKRMKESLKTTSKENATAIVNQRYRQELEDYWKHQGRLETIQVILYMSAYTINYKLGFGKKRLLRIMHQIIENIDAYGSGHLTSGDYKEIVKMMNDLGFIVD